MSLVSASSKSDGPTTSKQGSKSDFWHLLMTLCLDRDGGQSALSTSNKRFRDLITKTSFGLLLHDVRLLDVVYFINF